MSYDSMVFDPRIEFRNRTTFERHPVLAAMAGRNCEVVSADKRNGRIVFDEGAGLGMANRYSIGCDFIYAAFQSSKAPVAYEHVFRLAKESRVGFFDVSGEGAVWFPNFGGELEVAHRPELSDRTTRSNDALARLLSQLHGGSPKRGGTSESTGRSSGS
jgi:hypothetical protein